jgi:hypothetical protein
MAKRFHRFTVIVKRKFTMALEEYDLQYTRETLFTDKKVSALRAALVSVTPPRSGKMIEI